MRPSTQPWLSERHVCWLAGWHTHIHNSMVVCVWVCEWVSVDGIERQKWISLITFIIARLRALAMLSCGRALFIYLAACPMRDNSSWGPQSSIRQCAKQRLSSCGKVRRCTCMCVCVWRQWLNGCHIDEPWCHLDGFIEQRETWAARLFED